MFYLNLIINNRKNFSVIGLIHYPYYKNQISGSSNGFLNIKDNLKKCFKRFLRQFMVQLKCQDHLEY